MKLYLFVLIYFLSGVLIGRSQSLTNVIVDIKAKYSDVRKNFTSYDTTKIDIWDESTEGGEATGYYEKGNLKFIEAWWLGEEGKQKMECYFDKGELYFVFAINYNYNKPFYYDKDMAIENNDTTFFDPHKTTVFEDRYYFENTRLVKWFDNKKEIDANTPDFLNKGVEILEEASKLKKKFKN